MLLSKDEHIWATAQVPQRGTNSVEMLNSSWKGKNSSDLFQAVPSSTGYLEPLEDSTWSRNIDSAASMYPPPTLPLTLDLEWGEDYQDLSTWCSKLPQDMAADAKGSSGTVPDDELNTPEVGVQHDFNFTASCNVMKENTLQYLSEGWDTSPLLSSPPTLYSPQKSSFEEPVKKTDTGNTRSVTANEFFIDDGCVLSVSHVEEIVTSQNVEGLSLEFMQTKESDGMKKSVNLYEFGVAHGGKSMDLSNHKSVGKDSLVVIKAETDKSTDKMVNCVASTDKVTSLGSLLGSDFYVRTEGNDVAGPTNQLQAEEPHGLKNVLSGDYCSSNNNEIKGVDEAFGCDTIVSKLTDTELPRKCEIIRPVKTNTYMMMHSVGSEEIAGNYVSGAHTSAAEFAGQKAAPSILGTDIPVKIGQLSLPVNSERTGTTEHVEISRKNLTGVSSVPRVAGTREHEDMSDRNSEMQPQMALKEENALDRNLQLNLSSVCEGTDNSSVNISTPDVMEFLLKQDGKFDLIGYLFSNPKDFQQDLLPLHGDDRISASCPDETTNVEPIIVQSEQSPNDAELLDSTDGSAAVKVEVVKPFSIAKSDDERNDSVFEPMELEEEEQHCSFKHRSDKLVEGQARINVKKDFKRNKSQRIQKVIETRNDTQSGSTLESRILQDGSDLRLKISKVKGSARKMSSKKVVLPQEQVSPKENASELKEVPLPKRARGRPAKRALPSTSDDKNETCPTSRSPRRKLCSVDESWIQPSKRTRVDSEESCDRYRELRDKNNEASRKSRQNRKVREVEMKEYAANLERDNQTLKIKADEMERLVKKLREALLEAVVKTKTQ